tara:strand:- start:2952 stop:3620 length:669 start_codon:yes stop_codon:yes gene_type:complete
MGKSRAVHGAAHVSDWAQFHAYVLGSVIGIRWGKHTPTSGMGNPNLYAIVREYLMFAAGEDEWSKKDILDAMRDKSGSGIKSDARRAFPSLFPRKRKARPLALPDELVEEDVNFDPKQIEGWKSRVRQIKQEFIMNENAVEQEAAVEAMVEATNSNSNSRVTVNFFVPTNVSVDDLTLENYRELTGKRFRMTKDQRVVRDLTREQAFAESKALAITQVEGKF